MKKQRFGFRVEVEHPSGRKEWFYYPVWAEDEDEAIDVLVRSYENSGLKLTDFVPCKRRSKSA